MTICIPYFSGNGHTEKLAQCIADGTAGARLIDITQITDDDWSAMDDAPAIVFGTPTYMGSTAAAYGQFLEDASSRYTSQDWGDKIAAGFTVATYPSGDKLSTLMRLSIYAAQMGMIWVGQSAIGAPVKPDVPGLNRDGSSLGLMATASRDKSELILSDDAMTARVFGARIQQVSDQWHGNAKT